MSKYIQVIKNSISEYLTYRLNFILWRVRRVVNLLLVYFLWHAIFAGRSTLFGYDQNQMLTYILISNIVSSFIFATRTTDIGDEINSGDLSNYLLKPINYFSYWWAKDTADKLMNVAFSFVEVTLLVIFLKPDLFFQTNPILLLFFIVSTGLGIVLYFYISFLLGLIGFWSSEVWGPRFVFFVMTQFFVGQLFPLDILPAWLYQTLQLLPFPYLLFFPLKIYLGQLTMTPILVGLAAAGVWIILLQQLTYFVWRKGLANYTAQGR